MAASMLVNMGFISADVVEYVLIDYMIDTGFNVDFLYYDYDFSTNLRLNND